MGKKKNTSPLHAMRKHAYQAEAMLKEMANANRLMVLCSLSHGEKSVTELLESLDLSQSALSQHLARLRASELVDTEKRGKKVYYRLASPEVQAILSTLYLIFCHKK